MARRVDDLVDCRRVLDGHPRQGGPEADLPRQVDDSVHAEPGVHAHRVNPLRERRGAAPRETVALREARLRHVAGAEPEEPARQGAGLKAGVDELAAVRTRTLADGGAGPKASVFRPARASARPTAWTSTPAAMTGACACSRIGTLVLQ
jgi:hypothetical protein